MAWFKVDDRLYSSLKVMRIPRRLRTAAIGLWTMAGSWSAHDLTDGYIPDFMIEEFGAEDEHAQALVNTGLWRRVVPEMSQRDTTGTDSDVLEVSESTGYDEWGESPEASGYQFVKWSEYQPTKTDVEDQREKERDRKRKQRRNSEGKFAGQGNVPPGQTRDSQRDISGVTGMSQPGHAVPDPARPVPTRPQPTPNGVGDAPAKPRLSNRKTRMPDDWTPNESHEQKAAELGVDLHAEVEKFRDHAIANGKTFVDWSRGFHTWLNNALKFGPRPGGRPPERGPARNKADERMDQNRAVIEELRRYEEEQATTIQGELL